MTLPQLPSTPDYVATRHLCAAAHLDVEFRDHALYLLTEDSLHAVCPSFGTDSVAVVRHAAAARRLDERRDRQLGYVWAVALLGSYAVIQAGAGVAGVVAVLLVCWAASWTVCFLHIREQRRWATELFRSRTKPRDAAPAVDQAVEDRLNELATTNLIVYDTAQGDPFVGSGHLLHSWVMRPVSVDQPARDSSGNKRAVIPFRATDLHQYLAKTMPGAGFADLIARNRLYIRGDTVQHLREILPDRAGAPVARAPSNLVKHGADSHEDYARTYLCLDRISNGGSLVVSMFVRARLTGRQLTLECLTYVLPPPQARLRALTAELPTRGPRVVLSAIGACFADSTALLFGAPRRLLHGSRPRELRRTEARARRDIAAGLPFDYGAQVSLREAWAEYRTRERFKINDVSDDYQRLRYQLWERTEEFLDRHGVDTEAFKQEVKIISQQITNYSIESVSGSGNYFGSHGQVNNVNGTTPGNGQGTATP